MRRVGGPRMSRTLDPVATVIAAGGAKSAPLRRDTTLDDHGPAAARLRGARGTVIAKIVT